MPAPGGGGEPIFGEITAEALESILFSMAMHRAALVLLLALASADHPCDTEHGQHCPEDGPSTLRACLNNLDSLSEACAAWVGMHDACAEELKGYCAKACNDEPCGYANEAVACLTKWEKPENISPGCAASFPYEAPKVERVLSEKAKAKSAARKAARAKAAAQVRRMQAGENVDAESEKSSGPAAALPSGVQEAISTERTKDARRAEDDARRRIEALHKAIPEL